MTMVSVGSHFSQPAPSQTPLEMHSKAPAVRIHPPSSSPPSNLGLGRRRPPLEGPIHAIRVGHGKPSHRYPAQLEGQQARKQRRAARAKKPSGGGEGERRAGGTSNSTQQQ